MDFSLRGQQAWDAPFFTEILRKGRVYAAFNVAETKRGEPSLLGTRSGRIPSPHLLAQARSRKACAPAGGDVQPQASTHRGVADIVLRFAGAAGAGGSAGASASPAAAVWVLEVGMGGTGDAAAKLLQPQAYALAAGADVHCCAILVAGVPPAASASAAAVAAAAATRSAASGGGELVFFAWSRRAAAGHFERVSGGLAEPKTQTEATRGGQ